jgi:hypothetical protein
MIANCGRKKTRKPKNQKKNQAKKNDYTSTKKLKNKKKNQKNISASFTFLSPLRGEAD